VGHPCGLSLLLGGSCRGGSVGGEWCINSCLSPYFWGVVSFRVALSCFLRRFYASNLTSPSYGIWFQTQNLSAPIYSFIKKVTVMVLKEIVVKLHKRVTSERRKWGRKHYRNILDRPQHDKVRRENGRDHAHHNCTTGCTSCTVQPRPHPNISLRAKTKAGPLKPTPCSQSGKVESVVCYQCQCMD
jgi:hypothetical protein